MSRYDVRVAPRTQDQIDDVAAWWKTNRQGAPLLVVDEFEAAARRLSIAPLSGAIYRRTTFRSGFKGLFARFIVEATAQCGRIRLSAQSRRYMFMSVWYGKDISRDNPWK